jgi:hypothetical protein
VLKCDGNSKIRRNVNWRKKMWLNDQRRGDARHVFLVRGIVCARMHALDLKSRGDL